MHVYEPKPLSGVGAMERIFGIVSENHILAIAIGFVFLLAIYFLFKTMLKIALLGLVIVIAIGGYYYFQRPGARPSSVSEAVSKAKTDSVAAVEKGRQVVKKGKELAAEGRNAYEKGKKVMEDGQRAVDKGKNIFERGEDILAKILLFFESKDEKGAERKP
jgi:hypothetical protein